MMARRLRLSFLALCLQFVTSIANAQSTDIDLVNVNDWGSGFNAQFSYEITADDVALDKVRDWRLEVGYSGSASIGNAYMSGYSGSITTKIIPGLMVVTLLPMKV